MKYRPTRRRIREFENLEDRRILAADLSISEIMAANESTLVDAFDRTPDWIELYNAGDESADLGGMHLSDDIDNLNKWTFPDDTTLGPDEYLVVFASGLDLMDSNGSLHTNFSLDASGDYIALASPSLEVISDLTDGRDFRNQFSDVSFGTVIADPPNESATGFLPTPTPGGPNITPVENIGPRLRAVTKTIGPIVTSDDLVITATVSDRYAPTDSVTLTYRTMYGEEVSLQMTDDGQAEDAVSNDGVFSAGIPASALQDGEMIRWYVSATDAEGNDSREPAFLDATGSDQSPEYFGTIVSDAVIDTNLPVLEWYVPDDKVRAAGTRGGARGSVFYNGEFYDNIFVRLRGGSSASLNKKSYKFDFNTANDFRFDSDFGRVSEININTTYSNKDYIRQALAYEVYDEAGVPGSEAFPIRVEQNGEFFSVAILVEQPDADMLEREGLDADGALYKVYSTLANASGAEKRTREYESNADINDFARQVSRLDGDELRNYIFDNVNIPQVLNYLAATVIVQNNDQTAKNYFAYRDSDGTGEWSIFPWDLDLTFGLHFMSNDSILDDEIFADKDDFTTFAGATIWPSHPFVGDQAHPANRSWNRLIDALYQIPEIRQMHLRRLRTLMDEMLQSPDTPPNELKFERRLDEYAELIRADAALDYQKWADPWQYGEDYTLDQAMQRMKDLYFQIRREHLYETHGINNLNAEPPAAVIPEFAQASYFVPTDNALGTSWTGIEFDDTNWSTGQTGIGFENTPRNFIDETNTRVKPAETTADGTSIFMRIPFSVDNLAVIEDLTLQMKYDDGFVAYLNGTEVLRANLRTDGPQSFDSRARSHSTTLGTKYETFLLSDHLNLLQEGENVLAIHGMNSSAANSDMFFLPKLLNGKVVTDDIAGIPNAQAPNAALSFGDAIDSNPTSGNQDEEYFLIQNPNDFAVEVSGWTVEGSAHVSFAKGTVIPANGELFVSPNVASFRLRPEGPSGNQGLFVQSYNGHLSNTGGTLSLRDRDGRLVAEKTYSGGETNAQQALRVSEINYNPHGALLQFGELDTDNDSFEFVEIVNSGDTPIDLTGVQLVEIDIEGDNQGITFSFTEGTLAAGERTVVVKSVAAFASRYGTDISPAGEFTGKLSNGGETITLLDRDNDVIQQFRYGDNTGWPSETDGDGATLNIRDFDADFSEASNWLASERIGGTPGSAMVDAPRAVVINEIVTRTVAPAVDQIELYNSSAESVDLSGWYISDSSNFFKFAIPEGTVIAAGDYTVFDESTLGFGFKGNSIDDAWLIQPDATGKPQFIADHVLLPITAEGESIARIPDGTGEFAIQQTPTIGSPNGGAIRGDFNGDARIDINDVDILCQAIRSGDDELDLTGDGMTSSDDLDELIENILGTTYGDANLDGQFNSTDFVLIFQAAQYEDNIVGNSTWATGDWNADGEFTTADLVVAFQKAGYVAAAREH